MTEQFRPVQELLDRVRARWRRRVLFEVTTRAALAAAALIALALLLARAFPHSPAALATLGVATFIAVLAAIAWGVWPARKVPSDLAIARFIEERDASLDERIVTAVDVVSTRSADERPALTASMVRDAARVAAAVDADAIVPADLLRRKGLHAAAACVLLLALLAGSYRSARQSYDALALALFPSHIALEVTPGNARVQAGGGLTVQARLVGNRAPVVAKLLRAALDADDWQPTEMESDGEGHFRVALSSLRNSFRYKVSAGPATSAVFDVSVLRPPRVTRIDVEYTYPPALALAPRLEEDGGDIYAPQGTDVRVKVHTADPVTTGRLVLGVDKGLDLHADSPTVLSAALQVAENGSYRVALADAAGLTSNGETEYFIRILDDRPPEVHIVRPASDRRVTRLEEVEIAAEATDDFGVAGLDLVYAVRGGVETVVPLGIPPHSTSVTGHYVMYLEDLDVAPGDMVSYYVRARDLPRGKRSSESRSDIFFLEVKPFEEEFTLAQTQAAQSGGGGAPQVDELIAAQKEVIVATWKLDRRSRDAQGAKSEADIKVVSRAQSDLKIRVEQTGSSFRESTLRDPRRGRTGPPGQPGQPGGRGGAPQPPPPAAPRAGQTMPEEDAMAAASAAMGKAVTSLDALKTTDAMPSEIDALNALLRSQADVKKRQVQRQQAATGAGGNRSTEDMSSLFDKELSKHQQTNYENKTSAEQTEDKNAGAVDRIKDLARRQDELVQRQQAFSRNRGQMSDEEAKRQLESLTREQNDLRQRAEDVARQLAQQSGQQGGQQEQAGQQGQPGDAGQRSQSGQPSGRPGQTAGQQGQAGQSGERRPGNGQNARAGTQGSVGDQGSQQMRDVSEEMRSAASDLRREDTGQASARGSRALDKLRDLETRLQASTPEGRRRALGDLQLEARQLADAQRQISAESGRAEGGQSGADAMRRLAGEQERLAERLQRVEDGLRQQGSAGAQGTPGPQGGAGGSSSAASTLQQAASSAARDAEQQRLAERMQQSAEALRKEADSRASSSSATGQGRSGVPTAKPDASSQAGAQQELARALDRLADKLNLVDTPQDEESRKLSDRVTRVRDARDKLDDLTRQMQELDRQASDQNAGPGRAGASAPGRSGQPGQGQGGSSGDPTAAAQLRADLQKQMQEARQLLNDPQVQNSARLNGGPGATFEGQGMVLSAPGTEGFKQDFAKWQELTREITLALDDVETSLSHKLQEKTARERLASGGDERAPAEYQQQVDSYFKALATRKRP